MDEFDEDRFDDIIQDNFHIVAPASAHPVFQNSNTIKEPIMQNKATATDGIIVSILLATSTFFLVWAAFDIGWDHLRLITGLFLLSVLFQYSKLIDRKNK